MIRAQDIMSKDPLLVDVSIPVQDVARLMKQRKAGSVLVTKNKYPIGIITETDLARKIVSHNRSVQTRAEGVMSSPLYYSSPDADVLEVAAAMNINNIKKIPVIQGHDVVGVITQTDIVQHLFSMFKQMHVAYTQGKLSPKEFAEKSSDIVQHMEQAAVASGDKNWHMHCADCGHTFLNPDENGTPRYDTCPACGSQNISFKQV